MSHPSASGSGGAPPTATVLSSAQASQLLARLRAAGHAVTTSVGGGVTVQQSGGPQVVQAGAIKIQAVQTHAATGVRQIIAIPISAATSGPAMGGQSGQGVALSGMMQSGLGAGAASVMSSPSVGLGKVTVSPLKSGTALTTAQLGGNVKVLKVAPAGSMTGGMASGNAGTSTLSAIRTSATGFAGQSQTTTTTVHVANTGQVLTPSKHHLNNYVSSPATELSLSDLGGSSSRKRSDIDFDAFSSDSKRRKTEKGGKGLRHFSMKVCEKVQAKGTTSYNEVADELVSELTDPRCTSPTDQQYDQKNIRRRVYDALNVLMAMNIISKEKKEIRWLGLPTNSVQEANNLEQDKGKRMDRIRAKTQQLQDLILQQIAFKNLVERNKEREKVEGAPTMNSAIQLPFIIVNTSKKTVIDCSISNDKMEYLFNFDDTFEIHDDMEVLKRMGLGFGLERGQVSNEDLAKARQMVPRALEQYVTQLAEKGPSPSNGMPEVSDPVVLQQPDAGAAVVVKKREVEEESDSDVDVN